MSWSSPANESGDGVGAGGDAVPPPPPAPDPVTAPRVPEGPATLVSPRGRFGPLVTITAFEHAPIELTWQTPVHGELYRLVPGPDRPDYSVVVLERPVHVYPGEGFDTGRVPPERRVPDRKGRPMVRVDALVVCTRFVGQQLHAGMSDLAVNIAYVVDDRALTDERLDLAAIEYVGVGLLSEGRLEPQAVAEATVPTQPEATARAEAPARPEVSMRPEVSVRPEGTARPEATAQPEVDRVLREVATVLKEGIEAERGTDVQRLRATLTLDEYGRLVGLAGTADGSAPVPTRETFDRLGSLLEDLRRVTDSPVEQVTVTVVGDRVTWESQHRG